jgi:hypothetical protein
MPFDPKAYLRTKVSSSPTPTPTNNFNPKAYLQSKTPVSPTPSNFDPKSYLQFKNKTTAQVNRPAGTSQNVGNGYDFKEGDRNDFPVLGGFGSAWGNATRFIKQTPILGNAVDFAEKGSNAVASGAATLVGDAGHVIAQSAANTLADVGLVNKINKDNPLNHLEDPLRNFGRTFNGEGSSGIGSVAGNELDDSTLSNVLKFTGDAYSDIGYNPLTYGLGPAAGAVSKVLKPLAGGFTKIVPQGIKDSKVIAQAVKTAEKASAPVSRSLNRLAPVTRPISKVANKVLNFPNSIGEGFDVAKGALVSTKVSKDAEKLSDSAKILTAPLTGKNLPKTKTYTGPMKTVAIPKRVMDRTVNVIKGMGNGGKALANNIKLARDVKETLAGNWMSKIPAVRNLKKNEFTEFVDAVEGTAKTQNPKISQALREWNSLSEEIYSTAKNTKIDIGYQKNYFPRNYDPSIFSDRNKFNAAVDNLMKTGKYASKEEASKLLTETGNVVRNRKAGNLEYNRISDLPNYDKTHEALFNYIDNAATRIAHVNTFGMNDAKAQALISRIGTEGYDNQLAKKYFDRIVGATKEDPTISKISNGLRTYQTATKLGLGAITNAGQTVNTATVTGILRTIKNIPKAILNNDVKDFALKSGVVLDSVINDVREGSGFASKVLGKLTAPGFNSVEKFNRTLSAWAGKEYAESLALQSLKGNKKASGLLTQMGINPQEVRIQNGVLTEAQQIKAARNIVERTQFKVDPQDLPGFASTPLGRIATQFKSFSYNQTAFIGREVLDPLLKGDALPLFRLLSVGIPVGATSLTLKDKIRMKQDSQEPNPFKQVWSAFNAAGGLGITSDFYNNLIDYNSNTKSGDQVNVAKSLGGPTVGTALDVAGNILQPDLKSARDLALKQIPVVGTSIDNFIKNNEADQKPLKKTAPKKPSAKR